MKKLSEDVSVLRPGEDETRAGQQASGEEVQPS